jgi:hypothetical protein
MLCSEIARQKVEPGPWQLGSWAFWRLTQTDGTVIGIRDRPAYDPTVGGASPPVPRLSLAKISRWDCNGFLQ